MLRAFLLLALVASSSHGAPRASRDAKGPKVQIVARSRQPGEALLIVVTGHDSKRPPTGTFAGTALPFHRTAPKTYVALAGIDLEASSASLRLTLALRAPGGAEKPWTEDIVIREKSFATRRLTVAATYVQPGAALEARAEEETRRMKAFFAETGSEPLMNGRFRMPIKGAKTTSRFGERSVFNGESRSPHSGADLKASTGTAVIAPQAGRVVLTEDLFFPGGTVLLDHGLGVYSLFAHLSKIEAPLGRRVKAGELVARAGATGRVTGPHLHWAVRILGARVDPTSVMALPLERYLGTQKRTKR